MRAKLEILAMVLGVLGLIGVTIILCMPAWRVTAFIGANLIVMETLWEGLWMDCYRHANIRMQCKVYDSLLILPPELQAARGLVCVSVLLALVAILISACGLRGTSCCQDDTQSKNAILVTGGCLFLLSCLTTLVPVSWTAHTIIRDFYNPTLLDAQKRELGEALYIGWATSGLLLAAGVILLCRCAQRKQKDEQYYNPGVRSRADNVELQSKRSSRHSKIEYV